jgi:hypothetical protein
MNDWKERLTREEFFSRWGELPDTKRKVSITDILDAPVTSSDGDIPHNTTEQWKKILEDYHTDTKDIDDSYGAIMNVIDGQILGMSIPAGPVSLEATLLGCKNNVITGTDYKRICDFYYSDAMVQDASIPGTENLDVVDMIWTEIKKLIANWLAGLISDIPIVGKVSPLKDISDKLKETAEDSKGGSAMALANSLPVEPLNLEDLSGAVSEVRGREADKARGGVYADKVLRYVRDYVSEPRSLNFNPVAMDAYPITKTGYSAHLGVRDTFNTLYGIDNKVNFNKAFEYDKNNIRAWGNKELDKTKTRFLLADSNVYKDLYQFGVVGVKNTLKDTAVALSEYTQSNEVACCLLSNLGGIASADIDLAPLKTIRLGLRYAYNGLNINIGSGFSALTDLLNRIISAAMQKVVNSITTAVDDGIQSAVTAMRNFSDKQGDAWKRCYPFDELMQVSLNSMEEMKADLLAYLSDWTNLWKLSNVQTGTYMVKLKKREEIRKAILLTDQFTNGIYTGMVCNKNLDKKYAPPTTDELKKFREFRYRTREITAKEATDKFGRTPITGQPDIDENIGGPDPSDSDVDKLWLQNCSLSMTDKELATFIELMRGGGI